MKPLLTLVEYSIHYKLHLFIPMILFIFFNLTSLRFAKHYDYIKIEDVWDNLAKRVSKNITTKSTAPCQYAAVLRDYTPIKTELLDESALDAASMRPGGEYLPADCAPVFSTAIIVPYRDRPNQLKRFLTHIHLFLRRQNVHYRVYVVEQVDTRPFNRAKLLNIGAVAAMHAGFPCVVLHDVDLLPLTLANLYACTTSPRHMSSGIDKFRFNLPYKELFGGAVAILGEQFVSANGMSNEYFGWGAEDDDFYERLLAIHLQPVRFQPGTALYTMISHKPEKASPQKNELLASASLRFATDGLNSLFFVKKSSKLHPLFTHIDVEI